MTENLDKHINQSAALKVSLIPLAIIILLILGIGYFLLQGEINLPKFSHGPTMRRLNGFDTAVKTDKVLENQRRVVTSDQELNDFLNYVDSSGVLQLKDSVNFSKEVIIAVSSDTNNESGHRTKIKKVYEDSAAKKIIVSIEETQPGDSCQPTPDKSVAVDMVALTKTDWRIKFERVTKTVECN